MNLEYYIKLITGETTSEIEKFHPISSEFNYFLNPTKTLQQEIEHINLVSNRKCYQR